MHKLNCRKLSYNAQVTSNMIFMNFLLREFIVAALWNLALFQTYFSLIYSLNIFLPLNFFCKKECKKYVRTVLIIKRK